MHRGSEVKLNLRPRSRLDFINVSDLVDERWGDLFSRYRKAVYYSYHTTAGYLDQLVCARLNYDFESMRSFVRSFQALFPPDADYRHDQIHLRNELTEEEKQTEPRNADAHLTFIGSGLTSLATYTNQPRRPVYFIDLDGVNGSVQRHRQTSVIGFNRERLVTNTVVSVPVSSHPIDSINLKDRGVGLFDELNWMVDRYGIEKGRVHLSLDKNELCAGLTVNEYETLLMKHDLIEVLQNPLKFMAEKGKHILLDPRSIPRKAKGYAKYDFVQVLNEFLDAAGLSESWFERIVQKFMAYPASRYLRMKRSINLLISDSETQYPTRIVQGRYQSPVLVQWRKAQSRTRHLNVSLISLD